MYFCVVCKETKTAFPWTFKNSDQSTSGKEFARILIKHTSHTRALFYAETTLEQWKAVEN